MKLKGGWPISDARCEYLHKHNLQLHVTGDAKVLSGVSLGWVSLRLSRNDILVSGEYMTTTQVDSAEVNSTRAEHLLYMAIENSINKMDFEGATKNLAGLQIATNKKQSNKKSS
jgi:hypothetical protein